MPDKWKRSVLVTIFKNKGDAPSCSNCRGIGYMHTPFCIPKQLATSLSVQAVSLARSVYSPALQNNGHSMAFFTQSLQDLPQMTVNSRILQSSYHTSTSKKEKDFKLYVSSYIHNYEHKIQSCNVSLAC